jgi:effector-binding domain-containing protein
MAALDVKRSTTISAPLATLHASLIDYRQWAAWSPWLIIEPDAALEYSNPQGEIGCNYHWEGKLIGSGHMMLKKIADTQLEMQITFLTPFKSSATLVFELEPVSDNETNISWSLHGSVPFFMIPMLKKMKAYIGMDYERGLRMLKEQSETGTVSSLVTINGITDLPTLQYIGLANRCDLKDIGTVMSADFKTLHTYLQENNITTHGTHFSLYNDFDLVTQHAQFISAIAIEEKIEIQAPFVKGELTGEKTIKVTHTGSYPHLGNGWAAAMGYSREKKIKTKTSPVGIELYLNDPITTPATELITEIFLPLQ